MVPKFHRKETTPDWRDKTSEWLRADDGVWLDEADDAPIMVKRLASIDPDTSHWGPTFVSLLDRKQYHFFRIIEIDITNLKIISIDDSPFMRRDGAIYIPKHYSDAAMNGSYFKYTLLLDGGIQTFCTNSWGMMANNIASIVGLQ